MGFQSLATPMCKGRRAAVLAFVHVCAGNSAMSRSCRSSIAPNTSPPITLPAGGVRSGRAEPFFFGLRRPPEKTERCPRALRRPAEKSRRSVFGLRRPPENGARSFFALRRPVEKSKRSVFGLRRPRREAWAFATRPSKASGRTAIVRARPFPACGSVKGAERSWGAGRFALRDSLS